MFREVPYSGSVKRDTGETLSHNQFLDILMQTMKHFRPQYGNYLLCSKSEKCMQVYAHCLQWEVSETARRVVAGVMANSDLNNVASAIVSTDWPNPAKEYEGNN